MAKIKSKKPTDNRKGLPPKLEEASNNLVATAPVVETAVQTMPVPQKKQSIRKDLNFKVDPVFKKRFKSYATDKEMSMLELLTTAFEFYENNNR